ncbi:RRP12-like protein [Tanacetum coccineum]|uniref:RRP12-like protein n=1 Tax=Tanacetum coccineum TaxID=301880 RepID=A0ABQ5GC39_9ASTR
MKPQQPQTTVDDPPTTFTTTTDITEQLLTRYNSSTAPQHRHLIATAAATRAIILSESLPLNPLTYFAATIDALSSTSASTDADVDAVSALSSFLSIVLPLVEKDGIGKEKAGEAVEIVVEMVDKKCEGLSVSSVRGLVKCLGVLLEFCDLEDWESVKLGFETLLKFAIDKRPKDVDKYKIYAKYRLPMICKEVEMCESFKEGSVMKEASWVEQLKKIVDKRVRKCAQECLVKVFKSFQSPLVIKMASKLVLKSFKTYMSSAVKTVASSSADGSKDYNLSKCEHLEVLHMINLLKFLVPCLPSEVVSKAVLELEKAISSKFSPLTRHVFDVMEEILRFLEAGSTFPDTVKIVTTLASYMSKKQNPVDTVFSAAALLDNFLTKFQVGDTDKWNSHYSLIIGSIAGLLTSEATAAKASNILKEMMNRHIDVDFLSSSETISTDVNNVESKESRILKSICDALLKVLSRGIPNEHALAVISELFIKLGKSSHVYMESILLKLGTFMAVASGNASDLKHALEKLQECMGSAVIAMGPETLLAVLPISLDAKDQTCSNVWLIPILKDYVTGSSLGFFIESIVPLAESFQKACQKVKKSVIGEELHAHAIGCWGLLPAFCCYPNDTHKKFQSLVELLIPCIRKDAIMLEHIAIALQLLVKQNRSFLGTDQGDDAVSNPPKTSYSKKTATKNIKALASCSEALLKAFTKVFFKVSPKKRAFIKDTIRCLALITDSSAIKRIFISSVKRLELKVSVDKVNAKRCLILELASSIVGAASMDLIDLIYNFIKQSLQGSSEFCSSKFEDLMDLLLGLTSPVDETSLRWRFSCFRNLLIHSIEITLDGENTHGFRMLNEIIVTLKDAKEENRKVAYDILLGMSSSLQKTSSSIEKGPYYEFVSMIMGYLSGSSPQIKSGAVSALSLVVYNDSKICTLLPDLLPSILELLHSKSIEVIKAVLGFLKVLVLSLQAKDMQNFLPDILSKLLPWSSVSRHHFKSKVTVILEIMMRKCGSASVKLLVPEKYRDFVKDVLENRQNKTSSHEGVSTETDAELSETAPKSRQDRNPKTGGRFTKKEYPTDTRKRKWDDKNSSHQPRKFSHGGGNVHRKKEEKHSGHAKSTDRPSQGGKRKNTSFRTDNSGAKRQKQWSKGNNRKSSVT